MKEKLIEVMVEILDDTLNRDEYWYGQICAALDSQGIDISALINEKKLKEFM